VPPAFLLENNEPRRRRSLHIPGYKRPRAATSRGRTTGTNALVASASGNGHGSQTVHTQANSTTSGGARAPQMDSGSLATQLAADANAESPEAQLAADANAKNMATQP